MASGCGASTIRSVVPPGAFQIDSTSTSGLATASIEKDPLPISAARCGEQGKDSGRTDRTLSATEKVNVCLAQSSRRKADACPGNGPDLDPGNQPAPIVTPSQQWHDRRFGRFAPEIVENHINVCCLHRQIVLDHVGGGGEIDGVIGTKLVNAASLSAPRPAAKTALAPRSLAI